jgi:uncharacterized zinc-type alcohol dehydrogenase-like protein
MKKVASLSVLIIIALFSTVIAQNKTVSAKGFAVVAADGKFHPYDFQRHAVGDNKIQIDILYASICHSDVHHVHGDWGKEEYPMVPGHEIAGRVSKVGKNVTKFKVGDYAGVGCMVNSCGHCDYCKAGLEQYCKEVVLTYHDKDQFHNNETTQGGYSNNIVLTENFAIKIPANADLKKVAPLLCAGITTYSPIHYAKVKKGDKVGVAGFGGLGHMAVQYAVKIGAEVTVFDITEDKRADALRLGAVKYVNVNNPEDLKGLDNSLNFIISTIPANYDPNLYLKMLKIDGQMAIVGLPPFAKMPIIPIDKLIWQGNRKVFGSQIGGIRETQEMVDYSIANTIYPEVEIIPATATSIENAYQNVLDGKVKFRYVIDMKTMK